MRRAAAEADLEKANRVSLTDFAFKMMDFAFKMMNFALKMMDFAFKMMDV